MAKKTALVAGALGVVGRATMTYLEAQSDWEVIGLSRRAPDFETMARFHQLDLTDGAACHGVLNGVTDVTHVFFCAYAPRPSVEIEADVNLAMLLNLMEALEPAPMKLEHVQLVHGSKWYGCHLGPYKTPVREDDPRAGSPAFISISRIGWRRASAGGTGPGRRSARMASAASPSAARSRS